LGDRPVTELRRRDIIAMLETVAARSGNGTARQTLSVLRKLLAWALARDLPGFESNPAAAISVGDVLGHAQARERTLEDHELAVIWRALDAIGEPFATVHRLLLLTGARRSEISDLTWSEVDLDGATLTIPAARSKNARALIIPLSSRAVELIRATPRFSGEFVFSTTAGRRPVGALSQAKARLDAAITAQGSKVAPFVVHDFRRTVRSNLGKLGISPVVAELTIGHVQRGILKTYDRYQYLPERRAALEAWERHLMNIVAPPAPRPSNVVELAVIGGR
jgi:integrase